MAHFSRLLPRAIALLFVFFVVALPAPHGSPKSGGITRRFPDLARLAGAIVMDRVGRSPDVGQQSTAGQSPDSTFAVPWNGTLWQSMPNFTWAACDVAPGTRQAIDIAIGQWQYAQQNQGVPIRFSEVPCKNGQTNAQIALFETTTRQLSGLTNVDVFGATIALDASQRICGEDVPVNCVAQTADVILFTDNWVQDNLNFGQAAKTIAHELGHAVGLGHAHVCNFDSIMAQNCEPVLPGLGNDDVVSLDALVDYDRTFFGQASLHPQPIESPVSGQGDTVTYHAGWNFVAGPRGTRFSGAIGPLYTLVSGDSGYRSIPAGQPAIDGYGYWAYFPSDTTVTLDGSGGVFFTVLAQPGQWLMVGNDSGVGPMRILGASAAQSYDSQSGRYQATNTLNPGQGAWVLPNANGVIAVALASLTSNQLRCYLDLGNPTSC